MDKIPSLASSSDTNLRLMILGDNETLNKEREVNSLKADWHIKDTFECQALGLFQVKREILTESECKPGGWKEN